MRKKLKLDLACGQNKLKGFVGVDVVKKGTKADIEHDLLVTPWPFKDNSVDELYTSHFIEHIPHGSSALNNPFFDFFNEAWRVLKKGGTFKIIAPYYTSIRATQDPTHQRFISEMTFAYLDKKWRCETNQLSHYPLVTDFRIEKVDHNILTEWNGRSSETMNFSAMHYWNVVSDIIVILKKP
jgi:hypothetical protein